MKYYPKSIDKYLMKIIAKSMKPNIAFRALLKCPVRRVRARAMLSLFSQSKAHTTELAHALLNDCIKNGTIVKRIAIIYQRHLERYRLDPGEKKSIIDIFHAEIEKRNDPGLANAAGDLLEILRI
jgi:hypothetical protein